MAQSHPFAFIDENVRVGFGMDPDDKLNKANCLPSLKQIQNQNYEIPNNSRQACVVFYNYRLTINH